MAGICNICGRYSSTYDYCYECYNKQKFNEIKICETCNKIIENQNHEEDEKICIICGNPKNHKSLLCEDCYIESKNLLNNIEEEKSSIKLKDYYYDLLKGYYDITDINNQKNYLYQLFAIAIKLKYKYNSYYLLNRINKDFTELKNYTIKIKKVIEPDKDIRNLWPRNQLCEDGHYVRSKAEKIIDEWLYNHDYIHSYEMDVFLESNPDERMLTDFYLKKEDIYIEYWGLYNDNYNERKYKKIELYKKNDKKLICLEEEDIKILNDILKRKIYKVKNNLE